MTERCARRQSEPRLVLLVPRAELVGLRLLELRDVLGQEFHLPRELAFDDRVVLVEAERQRFAIQHFLAHLGLDQALHLLRRRRRTALGDPDQSHLPEVVLGQHDAVCRSAHVGRRVDRPPDAEQHEADQNELQQRFAQPLARPRKRPDEPTGRFVTRVEWPIGCPVFQRQRRARVYVSL